MYLNNVPNKGGVCINVSRVLSHWPSGGCVCVLMEEALTGVLGRGVVAGSGGPGGGGREGLRLRGPGAWGPPAARLALCSHSMFRCYMTLHVLFFLCGLFVEGRKKKNAGPCQCCWTTPVSLYLCLSYPQVLPPCCLSYRCARKGTRTSPNPSTSLLLFLHQICPYFALIIRLSVT